MNKKGNINQLFPAVLAIVLVGVLLGAGLMILSSFQAAAGTSTSAANATGSVITAMATLASTWLPIIVVVVAAGIVLAILLGAFGGKRR
jgi:type II secretory pathway component PulF